MTVASPGSDADRRFCKRLLPRVSRTFALSIEALPDSLREAVRTAYLLCRVVDTVEDAPRLSLEERVRRFDVFDALLADDQGDADDELTGFSSAHGATPFGYVNQYIPTGGKRLQER